MNVAQFIALLKLLLANKEQILELVKLIKSLFGTSTLIGDDGEATLYNKAYDESASYPSLAQAVSNAGLDWSEFVRLLIENLDEIKIIINSILEIIDSFKK